MRERRPTANPRRAPNERMKQKRSSPLERVEGEKAAMIYRACDEHEVPSSSLRRHRCIPVRSPNRVAAHWLMH